VYPGAIFEEALGGAGADVRVLRRCGMALPGAPDGGPRDGEGIAAFCERIAEHHLRNAVCPRMAGSSRLVEFIAAEIAAQRLSALVVPVLKFCDGYHLAADDLKRRLPEGFPILLVEGDLTAGFGEQTVTRLEAFVEGLRGEEPGRAMAAVARERLVVGVDVGSTQVKAVLLDDGGNVAGVFIRPTTGRMADASEDAIGKLLSAAGVGRSAIAHVGATGYGRKSVSSDAVATEISCHARGVSRFFPEPATVIDVGGQDSKVIVTDGAGRVVRFTMNDKCAAGTGRFIDGIVRALDLDFARFSRLALEARAEVPVTSMCSVFAESEVISLSARGEPLSGIARGINASIARRVAGMVHRVDGAAPFVLTGGVSQIPGFVRELERELGSEVRVLEYAPYAGAIGAAMLAREGLS
jgi:predicted CoA-substrate-specific enzyme activase